MAFLLPLNLRSFIDSAHSTQMVCLWMGGSCTRVCRVIEETATWWHAVSSLLFY
jgi:hypothetical protein